MILGHGPWCLERGVSSGCAQCGLLFHSLHHTGSPLCRTIVATQTGYSAAVLFHNLQPGMDLWKGRSLPARDLCRLSNSDTEQDELSSGNRTMCQQRLRPEMLSSKGPFDLIVLRAEISSQKRWSDHIGVAWSPCQRQRVVRLTIFAVLSALRYRLLAPRILSAIINAAVHPCRGV